jgi:hypothetical protein
VVPEAALRKHHLVGEHHGPVEFAVPVCVFEAKHAMGRVFQLLRRFRVRAGRIGDVEPSLVIETRADRAQEKIGAGGEFNLKAFRQGERLTRHRDLRGSCAQPGERQDNGENNGTVLHRPLMCSTFGFRATSALKRDREALAIENVGGRDAVEP